MTRSWRRASLLAASASIGLFALACQPSSRREARDFERMRRQQRYDAYDASRFFANGAVMQVPPAHTVNRDLMLAAREQTSLVEVRTGRTKGGYAVDVPIPIDATTRARGARQYEISCAPCHGAGGFGGGTVAPNLTTKRPPSLRNATVAAMPAGMLFAVITDGFGRMPPFGWQLSPEARWLVVAHIRSLTTVPQTEAEHTDSAMASYLRQLDSLRAAGAGLEKILQFRRQRR